MADSGFIIDGIQYEVPSLDSFTMAEAKILYDCSGLALEDFAVDQDDPEASENLRKNLRNPGFIEALMVVAYVRGNHGTNLSRAKSIIGKANLVDAIQNMADGDDASPPDVNPDGITSTNGTSGESSGGDSAGPDTNPRSTGTSA